MSSYRVARRAFLQSIGAGAVGLKTMLRTMEAAAQGVTSPPRFLMAHWPVGTVRYAFLPTGSGTTYTTSPILKPFEDAGLRDQMIVLFGLSMSGMASSGGGGHEAGTPKATTGANCAGTRRNGGEGDDAAAGGPSWDQIFLKNVPALKPPGGGAGFFNVICDARVDSLETSTQCLSYDYLTQTIASAAGGTIVENIPLPPELSPLQAYTKLFSGFMPGGGGNMTDTIRRLRLRKSVLDSSLRQLARLKTLAPGSQANKIEAHASAIRSIEMQLSSQINAGTIAPPRTCTPPPVPPADLSGKTGSKNDYKGANPTTASVADDTIHADVARAHMGILRTAFACDLIRVATFQFSPGTNHVSFKGLYPDNPNGIYMHHPTSHVIMSGGDVTGSGPPSSGDNLVNRQSVVQFLINVQTWYNRLMAELLVGFKTSTDVFGGNLLDNTIIPFVTEVAHTVHSHSPMPAMIFGGSKLGMRGGQFVNLNNTSTNAMWLSIAQAYFKTATPLDRLPATSEKFVRNNVAPIPNLWAMPP